MRRVTAAIFVLAACSEAGEVAPRGPQSAASSVDASSSSSSSVGDGAGPGATGGTGEGGLASGGSSATDATSSAAGGGGAGGAPCVPDPLPPLDPARSLYVVDAEVLERFSLQRVLEALLADAESSLPARNLYRQWWDLNNSDQTGGTYGAHCASTWNGFPYTCPRGEGQLAFIEPFDPTPKYHPLAVINRFDRAPRDGSSCGQYRVSFAFEQPVDGQEDPDSNYLIFEAVLPNPEPELGLGGCRPVADFWYGLSSEADVEARAEALDAFFFEGLPGFPPVFSWEHLAGPAAGGGGIRTNQFLHSVYGQPWQLREYRLVRGCPGGVCSLIVLPETVKESPYGALFAPVDAPDAPPGAPAFQAWLVGEVAALAQLDDVAQLALAVPDEHNAGESTQPADEDPAPEDLVGDYVLQAAPNEPLLDAVQAELDAIGSTLTPSELIERVTALSCAGCHHLSAGRSLGGGLAQPATLGFVHTDVEGNLSPALTTVYLPARAGVLQSFVEQASCEGSGGPAALTSAAEASGSDAGPFAPTSRADARHVRAIGGGWSGGH